MDGPDQRASLLRARLTSAFQTELAVPPGTEHHLAEALTETLQRTGNFIRAQLAYSMAQSYGLQGEAALQLAIAMEYFHTASLLFDDLPSMDDATHRRGAMCVHHLYGEGSAILTALALINRGYALLWRAVSTGASNDPSKEEALAYVEKYLGLGGLLNGQSHDLHYSELPLAERSPQNVAMGKTVSLIRLSLVLPAIMGGAAPGVLRLLDRLAVFWGLAYQALDDLKDVLQETELTGKTTARDTLLNRPNLALTIGSEATLRRLDRLVALGKRLVDRLQHLQSSLTCLDVPGARLEREVAAVGGELLGAKR